ncbi:hypothetical protein EON66_07055 [archaeon]|nr:MAG: hypothetical protein EON66_07055 [archaeon]
MCHARARGVSGAPLVVSSAPTVNTRGQEPLRLALVAPPTSAYGYRCAEYGAVPHAAELLPATRRGLPLRGLRVWDAALVR